MSILPVRDGEFSETAVQSALRRGVLSAEGFIPFPRGATEQSIPDRFEQQVARYPTRIALKTVKNALTYEALNRAANRIARTIVALRGTVNEPIAFLLKEDAQLIAGILGALKAGKIYVALDPSYPRRNISFMLDDSQAALLLTDEAHVRLASSIAGKDCTVVNLEENRPRSFEENLGVRLSPDKLAYIFYTSGSTGRAKGVVDNHRNVLHNIMRYTNALGINAGDRLTLLQSCSFSGSVSSLFAALLNGATSFPFDFRVQGPRQLAKWVAEEGLTIYHSVPMIFRHLADGNEQYPNLKIIRLEGDRCSALDVDLFKGRFSPKCVLVNGLGATETGLSRQYFMDGHSVLSSNIAPVGYPVEDFEALVLDDDGNEAICGVAGEIAFKSRYLAVGYWRKPELTQAAFAPVTDEDGVRMYRTGDLGRMRSDGCLDYLGRKDLSEAKVRGHRVVLTDIEAALATIGSVTEAVVVAREGRSGDQRLVAYVVPATKEPLNFVLLRSALSQKIPQHMLPSAFVVLGALPLNANGKVDREALPSPGRTRPEIGTPYVEPLNKIEQIVASIWSDVLEIDSIGRDDSFLDLGGDSLLAGKVAARIYKVLHFDLSLRHMLDSPTVSLLAARIGAPAAIDDSMRDR